MPIYISSMQAPKASLTSMPMVSAPSAKVMAMTGCVNVMGIKQQLLGSLSKRGIDDGFLPGVSWPWFSSLQCIEYVTQSVQYRYGYTSRAFSSSTIMLKATQVSPTELALFVKRVGESAFGHVGLSAVYVPSGRYVADIVNAIKLHESSLAEVSASCIRVRKLLANGEPGPELKVDTKIADAGLEEGEHLGFEVVVHRGNASLCTIINIVLHLLTY
jgi:hypothetical protein